MCEFIKSIDLFGHRIKFNFNQKGSTYKTSCGGFLSLVLYIVVIYTLLNTLLNMQLQLTTSYSRSEHSIDWKEMNASRFSDEFLNVHL